MQAAEVLNNEIKKNPNKQKELSKELDIASTLFFSNEGQRLYELAETLRLSNSEGAIEKYEESLQKEDLNLKVILGLGLAYFSKNKCDKVFELATQGMSINPYSTDLKILYFKSFHCSKKKLTLEDEEKLAEIKNNIYFKMIQAQMYYEEEKSESALRLLQEIQQLDKELPAIYYLAWKILKNEPVKGRAEAENYLRICKMNSPKLRRKYYFITDLCVDTEKAEEYLKKIEVNN